VYLGQPEADTEVIVRSMLSYLIANGQQPSNKRIYVSADAAKHARGATGKPLAAMFGYAYYDYGNDLIRYVACTGKRGWASWLTVGFIERFGWVPWLASPRCIASAFSASIHSL
jgi:hypothetical protein